MKCKLGYAGNSPASKSGFINVLNGDKQLMLYEDIKGVLCSFWKLIKTQYFSSYNINEGDNTKLKHIYLVW